MNLALFDFDGTLTAIDTFSKFMHLTITPMRKIFGTVFLAPWMLAYKAGLIPGTKLRKKVVYLGLYGRAEEEITKIGEGYARDFLPTVLRPEAMERLRWHQSQGDKVIVVSASLSAYLDPWCREHGVDLICTQLESKNGKILGKYDNGDCTGVEKSNRILKKYRLSEFPKIYAYGDTEEDLAMLDLATEKYFRWKRV